MSVVNFRADDRQIQNIAINAILNSSPEGLGYLQYDKDLEKEALNKINFIDTDKFRLRRVDVDYFQGRMVKLRLCEEEKGVWRTVSASPGTDHQSWARVYPGFEDLLKSVTGVEIIDNTSE